MGEVAAHAPLLDIGVIRGAADMGMLVAEGDMLVDEIADRLHQPPTFTHLAESRPGDVRQAVGLAIAAAEQINQRVDGQRIERELRGEGRDGVRLAAVVNEEIGGERQPALRRADHMANIAEAVDIFGDRHEGVHCQFVLGDEVEAQMTGLPDPRCSVLRSVYPATLVPAERPKRRRVRRRGLF